jgi:TolB-like protein
VTPTFPAVDERYEILAELGSGGMGIVYKARDRETGDTVALKVLHPSVAGRADLVERLTMELRLARKITHKNVCRVYDINRVGQVAAISMEYLEGESLRALLDRRRLPLPEAFDVIRQVLAGVAEAHAQGVVHRDLKPANIFVSGDGTIKVMDFGLARNLDTDATTTAAGLVLGSPAYMSPEQLEGKTADTRSDIYALGMVLYEIFCGRRAFSGETPIALAMKHVHEAPPSLRVHAPDLPKHVESAVLTCLKKDPSHRHQNLAALGRALFEPDAAGDDVTRALRPGAPAARTAVYALTALIAVSAGTFWYARSVRGAGTPPPAQARESAAATSIAPAQAVAPNSAGQKISIAALEFQNAQNQAEFTGLKLGIADALAGAFARSGRFRIVERTQLDQALKELDLNQTDRIDSATVQRVGKLIGAQYLTVGSFQVVGGQIRIDARLLRVETGEVVQADSITGAAASALALPDRLAERLLSKIQ